MWAVCELSSMKNLEGKQITQPKGKFLSLKKWNVDIMFRLKTSSRIKNSKLKSRRSEIIVHLHIAIVRILNKALIVMLQGRCAETFLDKNCFRVPLL